MTDHNDLAERIERAAKWLRECSTWMLTNDLDMRCPMETDPLSLAEDLEAASPGLHGLRCDETLCPRSPTRPGAAMTGERERVVAWLQERAENTDNAAAWAELVEIADLIEQGDHMKGQPDD